MAKCPTYGNYDPYGNPFGTGFFHGWKTGLYASTKEILDRYPEMTAKQVELYLNGRDDGVRHDTFRLNFTIAA